VSAPDDREARVHDDPLEQITSLVRERRGALAAAARAEGVSPEEALECVQEALCTYLRVERENALPAGPVERAAAAFTMVRNAARNLRRRHHRVKPHVPLEDEFATAHLMHPPPPPDELLAAAESTVRLRACVATLCSVQRAVVTLRLLEERSGEDVATTLGLSRGYVDVLVHRARHALRVCMHGGAP
jgi:RNA polymerase sigma-70 factor, ECF subfamily